MLEAAEIQKFFFKAMLEGWAGDKNAVDDDMIDYKVFTYEDKERGLVLSDRFLSIPNCNNSAGTTTIWHEDRAVWWMQYHGWYDPKVIPFLKSVLVEAYKKEEFYGGRGLWPRHFEDLTYMNSPRFTSDFKRFSGEESIDGDDGQCFGYHEYSGMSLL